jgi:peptidoglycan hydrolase-like protein with peptidoglycan-binding domain
MPLQSRLFRGDAKLEAAAVSDPAHIMPGTSGDHVRKIQLALNRLDGADLDPDGRYGQATADAVLAYKRKRNIVNRSYQTQADNIVGKMTIAALDRELVQKAEPGPPEITVQGDKPRLTAYRLQRRPPFRLVRGFDGGPPSVTRADPQFVTKFTRWSPKVTGTVRCAQTGDNTVAVCTNEPDPSIDPRPLTAVRIAFLSDIDKPSNPSASPTPDDGGRVPLLYDPHFMQLETFRPGDATITVARPDVVRMLVVEVRQHSKGPVARAPLTKLTMNSKFFSASKEEGGEFDPGDMFMGRPVNPKLGGRLINLGGDTETPLFEDYQVDLTHSFDHRGGFRPWANDPDPAAFIPSRSASHITMRATPLLDPFIKVIRRIAQPGCRFTFSGMAQFLDKIEKDLPGHRLEEPIRSVRAGTPFVELAWEIH